MTQRCVVCNSNAEQYSISGRSDFNFHCPICGEFDISFTAIEILVNRQWGDGDKELFSAYLRNKSEQKEIVRIDAATVRGINDLIEPLRNIFFDEKIDRIIKYVGGKTKQIGNPVQLSNLFYLFYFRNIPEFVAVLDMMKEMGFGKRVGDTLNFALSADGWRRYDALKNTRVDSKNAFVAMSFKPDLLSVFKEGIEPACRECGYTAVRVDQTEHNQKICDKIIAEIKASRFLIADFTDPRYGVYFEAGFANGLGIPVIWTCNQADVDKLHFDTRQYNHIVWDSSIDLKEKLVNRIKALIK